MVWPILALAAFTILVRGVLSTATLSLKWGRPLLSREGDHPLASRQNPGSGWPASATDSGASGNESCGYGGDRTEVVHRPRSRRKHAVHVASFSKAIRTTFSVIYRPHRERDALGAHAPDFPQQLVYRGGTTALWDRQQGID